MSPEVLSRRALNRSLLSRQLLLSREPAVADDERAGLVLATIEHLAGLQAQAPLPPDYGLWSRLADFHPGDLAGLLVDRRVVRIALMRGTIHLVSARDCLLLRPLLQPVLDRGLAANYGPRLAGVSHDELAAAGRALAEEQPRTFSELGELLSRRWPGRDRAALAQCVRALVPLVQVPPRAIWGAGGQALHTSAESWLGQELAQRASLAELVRRYLTAFGPATVADMQAWSGLTRLAEVVAELRPGLREFRDEHGRELWDLPDAPRPDPDAPAPVALVAEFDNLLLSHADRARVISEAGRKLLFTRNGVIPGAVLVDGFVAGSWRITTTREAAALVARPFGPIASLARTAIAREGLRLLAFARPDAGAHDVRFEPVSP
jgi:Winged helix DNA-binding domain